MGNAFACCRFTPNRGSEISSHSSSSGTRKKESLGGNRDAGCAVSASSRETRRIQLIPSQLSSLSRVMPPTGALSLRCDFTAATHSGAQSQHLNHLCACKIGRSLPPAVGRHFGHRLVGSPTAHLRIDTVSISCCYCCSVMHRARRRVSQRTLIQLERVNRKFQDKHVMDN